MKQFLVAMSATAVVLVVMSLKGLGQGGPGDPGQFPCNGNIVEDDGVPDIDVNTIPTPIQIEARADWEFECEPEAESFVPKTCKWCVYTRVIGWKWHTGGGGYWEAVSSGPWVYVEPLQDVCNWPSTGDTDFTTQTVNESTLLAAGAIVVTVEFGVFGTATNGVCTSSPTGDPVVHIGTTHGTDLNDGSYVLVEE